MSTDTLERSSQSGLQSIIQQAEASDTPEMTVPSPDELAAQARLSRRLFAGHRQGRCYVEAHPVEDGYAYRLVGSKDTDQYQWMRTRDFDHIFQVWTPISVNRLLEINAQLQSALDNVKVAEQTMGKATRKRYRQQLQRLITQQQEQLEYEE